MVQLALEDVLAPAVVRFAEVRNRLDGYRPDMMDHPVAGCCLRYYLILTECPDLQGEHRLSEAVRYWSRYYWLFRFARVWSAVVGYDAGLEQQVFQLLESAPDGLDALPELEAAAERAAGEQLRVAGIA
jgi:hypothetical protein